MIDRFSGDDRWRAAVEQGSETDGRSVEAGRQTGRRAHPWRALGADLLVVLTASGLMLALVNAGVLLPAALLLGGLAMTFWFAAVDEMDGGI